MALTQLRNVNFGKTLADKVGSIGYTLVDSTGSVTSARTTTGVFQTVSGSGLYSANIVFPDGFRGQVVWDSGNALSSTVYATEQFNIEENNPSVEEIKTIVTASAARIEQLYDIQYGRWKIVNNSMVFYKEDNVTVVATFNLLDENGNPTMDAVFDRRRVLWASTGS